MRHHLFYEWIWSIFARHSDGRLLCAVRQFMHWLIEFLHAENHDFHSNGEVYLLQTLGAGVQTIIDVGANRGMWALEARRFCPNAVIYCFEIATEIRRILCQNVAGITGIHVLNSGLADHNALLRLKYYQERDTVTSLYDYPHPERYCWSEAHVGTGDEFMEEHNLTHIDLLKIDTEGADFRVLLGFENALSRGSISVIQFEYGYACVLAKALLHDFYAYLEPKGYVIGKLHAQGVDFKPYRLKDENFFGPNFVAVHGSHCSLLSSVALRKRFQRGQQRL